LLQNDDREEEEEEEENVLNNQKERQLQKKLKENTHCTDWTPDSAALMNAYLILGCGSNVNGILQCANEVL